MVSRDYSGDGLLRIYDNTDNYPNMNLGEHPIKVSYVRGKFYYMGKYRISVYTNGLVETARDRQIEVQRRVDTDST